MAKLSVYCRGTAPYEASDKHVDMDLDGRVAKRQKLANGAREGARDKSCASRIFAPYRTVGLVSPTSVPFTSVPLGQTTFQITTSVGRSLQTYDLRRGLNLVFITRPQTPAFITASVAWKDKLLAAYGGDTEKTPRGVWLFKRGRREAELEWPADFQENVKAFCVFGAWIVGVCEQQMLVWKSSSLKLYACLRGISPVPFTKCVASLPTFLNKTIVGRQDGSAEIWNVSSGKLVYTIIPPSTTYGAVTAIEPTPALPLVAIAFHNGAIAIHDVKCDRAVMQLNAPASAPVTSISFRTDGMGAGEDGRKAGMMATSSSATGDITLWDLNNNGRKAGVLRAAHSHPSKSAPGGTSRVEFLAGQAILVSSGLDNSLKSWIFDETPFSPVPRILHERRGHGAPVSRLMFLPTASDGSDDTGKWLLSGSDDRSLWGWSLRRDGQSTELSQGAMHKKAKKQGLLAAGYDTFESLKCPPITAMACSMNRDGGIGAIPGKQAIWQPAAKGKDGSAEVSAMTGWESVLTAHANDNKARTWFWGRKRAGRWIFETGDGGSVSSVAMSPCGTFAVIGSEKGGIDMFNLQSGIHRQRFPARLTPMQAKQLRLDAEKYGLIEDNDGKKKFYRGMGKHAAAVVGLATDNLNKILVSAGADGKIKFWDFNTGLLKAEINWTGQTGIIALRFHRASDLAAFACEDGCIRVVDITTQKLVRELWFMRKPIDELANTRLADFAFSNDGCWVAACAGTFVFLWDLPTGHLIDAFMLPAPSSSIAFSPTGEFFATASKDNVGVDIWANRTLFTHVPSRHICDAALEKIIRSKITATPTASGEGAQQLLTEYAGQDDEDSNEEIDVDINNALDNLSSDLLSLSLVPTSRWQNLLHLDLIRQRNKPVEPPKKPEKAPFFLPSLQQSQDGPSAASTLALLDAAATSNSATTRGRQEGSHVLTKLQGQHTSHFTTLLGSTKSETSSDSGTATQSFLSYLSSLSPSNADIEIRSLQSDELVPFVAALTWSLLRKRDFELVQAWMAVFLRCHGEVLVEDPDGSELLRGSLEEWKSALDGELGRVGRKAGYVRGMVGWARAGRV